MKSESAGIGSAVPPPVVRHPLPGRLAAAFVLRGGVMRADVDGAETAALALRERQIDEAVRHVDAAWPRSIKLLFEGHSLGQPISPHCAACADIIKQISLDFDYIVLRDAHRS